MKFVLKTILNTKFLLVGFNVALCLVFILAGGFERMPLPIPLLPWRAEVLIFLQMADTQWIVFVLLIAHILIWSYLADGIIRPKGCVLDNGDGKICLANGGNVTRNTLIQRWASSAIYNLKPLKEILVLFTLTGWSILFVFTDYVKACQPPNSLVFVFGITLYCYGFVVFNNARVDWMLKWGLAGLTCLALLGLKTWHYEQADHFKYLNVRRLTGIWDSPNTLGLLMAITFVASIIVLIVTMLESRCSKYLVRGYYSDWQGYLAIVPAIVSLIVMLQSFSRAAWLGTAFALGMIAHRILTIVSCKSPILGVRVRHWLFSVLVIVVGVGLIGFWSCQTTKNPFVRRILSVANRNDFSWRNRIGAWEGALQMMADHPLCGWGWNRIERPYIELYLPPSIDEGGGIDTNDFIGLGTSLGIPALMLFVYFINLRWNVAPITNNIMRDSHCNAVDGLVDEASWWSIGRQACIVVLLTGLFLDGVLFRLPVASAFWVLLGLSSVQKPQPKKASTPTR